MEYVRGDRGRRPLAGLRLGRPVLRLGLLRAPLRVRRELSPKGLAYVDELSEEEIRAYRGTVTEPGRRAPSATARRENLELFRRMRAGEFPTAPRAAGEDRPGLAEHEDARPAPLPDPPRPPLPDRRRLVHLPDVRLRPLPVGRLRGHHPLALHARVREQPRALRLDRRRRRTSTTRGRARSSSPGSTSPTPCSPSGAARAGRGGTSRAGTTRGCPPSPGCAAAA
jgi:hypothetical protein